VHLKNLWKDPRDYPKKTKKTKKPSPPLFYYCPIGSGHGVLLYQREENRD